MPFFTQVWLGLAYLYRGAIGRAVHTMATAVEQARQESHPFTLVSAVLAQARFFSHLRDLKAAIAATEEGHAIATAQPSPYHLSRANVLRVVNHIDAGGPGTIRAGHGTRPRRTPRDRGELPELVQHLLSCSRLCSGRRGRAGLWKSPTRRSAKSKEPASAGGRPKRTASKASCFSTHHAAQKPKTASRLRSPARGVRERGCGSCRPRRAWRNYRPRGALEYVAAICSGRLYRLLGRFETPVLQEAKRIWTG